jgi:hypothetical protein
MYDDGIYITLFECAGRDYLEQNDNKLGTSLNVLYKNSDAGNAKRRKLLRHSEFIHYLLLPNTMTQVLMQQSTGHSAAEGPAADGIHCHTGDISTNRWLPCTDPTVS